MPDPALAANPVVFDWHWSLQASPERLWPLISDTNRINQLARMAPASVADAPGEPTRTGESTQLGLSVSWDEHPFEWAYPYGFTVLREFHNGVLLAYRSTVSLTPDGDGTRLTHRVELLPRLGLMAAIVAREGPKQQRNWDFAYKAIDAYLAGAGPWPFNAPRTPRPTDETMAMAAAIRDESEHPELELRLFDHVLTGPDEELTHVRPYVLADRWRADRETVLSLCRYAVSRKLLTPQWSLLCPHCRGAKGTAARLADLARDVFCASCNIQFQAVSDESVELTFRPTPLYRTVQEATYCVGGPGATPHIVFQSRLQPQSTRAIALKLEPGRYRLRGSRYKTPVSFIYHGGLEAPEAPVVVSALPDGFAEAPAHLEGPKLSLEVASHLEHPLDLVVETGDWRDDVVTLAQLRSDPELVAQLGG
jgi:hypothetical protein